MGLFDRKGPATDAGEDNTSQTLTQLLETVQGIVTTVQSQQEQINAMATMHNQPQTPTAPKPEPSAEPKVPRIADLEDEVLDAMSRKDYTARMQQELIEGLIPAIKEIVTPIADKVSTLETRTFEDKDQQALASFINAKGSDNKLKHPDLKYWIEDMKVIIKNNPKIGYEDAYVLAKHKAKQFKPEIYQKAQDEFWPKEPEKSKIDFGGIFPTTMGAKPIEEVRSVEEAAIKAFQDEIERNGPIPTSDTPPS